MDTSNKENKAKTVTTIDIHLPAPPVSQKDWRLEEISEHFHCVICGTELILSHKTDFIEQNVSEQAHCPSCKIRVRQGEFKLQ